MRESKIETRLRALAAMHGCLCYKWTSPGRVGVPDRIVIFPTGQVVFVELKAPGKTLRPSQVRQVNLLRAHKQMVFVIDSMEGVEELFT